MKKQIITALLLLSAMGMKAQNAIIYTEYHPDTCFTFESVENTFTLDINQDGSPDAFFAAYWHSAGGLIVNMHVGSDWRFCHSLGDAPLTDSTIIDDSLQWSHPQGSIDLAMYPDHTCFAFRHLTEDGYHYGWAHIYLTRVTRAWHTVCVSGMGYCTLPDQPIQWGQTEYLGINEFASSSINYLIRIQCNPSTKYQTKRDSQVIIINVLENNKVEIPYNQIDVHTK